MKRRSFFKTYSTVAASSIFGGHALGDSVSEQERISVAQGGKLGGMTLETLKKRYHTDLFDDFLPFLEKYVIDHKNGGFMCNTDRDGTHVNTHKRSWYDGRGVWTYSYLYSHIDPDPHYLEIARKTAAFIMKLKPAEKSFWPEWITREGKPLDTGAPNMYGDLYIAQGLQEFSLASGDGKWYDEAKDIMFKCLAIYDNRPGYYNLEPTDSSPGIERPRLIGHWFVLLRLGTQMLEKRYDSDVEAVVDRCLDAIMNHHVNPDHGLVDEYLHHDLSRIDGDYGQVGTGLGHQTMWMVMSEALRRKDRDLFLRAARVLRRLCEVFWDDVYGGYMAALKHVDNNVWDTSKSLWLQDEVLIGTMCVVEHTGADWAKEWFAKTYTYVSDKFTLAQYGYPLWILFGDRKITFEEHADRVGNYHHPRQLMLNMRAIDRMIQRGGRVSNAFG